MSKFQTIIISHIPRKHKNTPTGWISFNSVCCHHRGQTQDKRSRAGVMITADGWTYNCFNCNFKAGWTPGHNITSNTKNLMDWMNFNEDEKNEIFFEALRLKGIALAAAKPIIPKILERKELPKDSKPILQWIDEGSTDEHLVNVVNYILGRGMKLEWFNWYWCPELVYRERALIPFMQDNICVGWTARHIVADIKPKYLAHSQPGFVFNLDNQKDDRKYVLVVEGQFDAIAIDGVAIAHNDINSRQIEWINSLNKTVILVPDQDAPGSKLIEVAIEQNWAISVPEWERKIKDVADAVKNYGRLFTLISILQSQETNHVKMQLIQKKLEQRKKDIA